MAYNFEKFAQEGNQFLSELATELGHPNERHRVGIILRAVLHSIRDRIAISESLDFISLLPFFLKAIYVDQWKYDHIDRISDLEEFTKKVEAEQIRLGENLFDWDMSTADIIRSVFSCLRKHISDKQAEQVINQMPRELRPLFEEQYSEK